MADSKLSALPEATALPDTTEFYVNDAGVSKRTLWSTVKTQHGAQPAIGSSTWALRGSGSAANALKWITDVGPTGGALFRWVTAGTPHWHVVAPTTLFMYTTLETSAADTTEQIHPGKQYTFPIGLMRAGSYFAVHGLWAKNGGTDAATVNQFRLGPLGTIADPALMVPQVLGSTNRSIADEKWFVLTSATNLRILSSQVEASATIGAAWAGAPTTQVYPKDKAISDVDANAMILSMSIQLVGTTNLGQTAHMIVTLFP
jgi:hypothetical protein